MIRPKFQCATVATHAKRPQETRKNPNDSNNDDARNQRPPMKIQYRKCNDITHTQYTCETWDCIIEKTTSLEAMVISKCPFQSSGVEATAIYK